MCDSFPGEGVGRGFSIGFLAHPHPSQGGTNTQIYTKPKRIIKLTETMTKYEGFTDKEFAELMKSEGFYPQCENPSNQ